MVAEWRKDGDVIAVVTWVRSVLRGAWKSYVAVGVLVGLGLGFALTAGEGARRAGTAYERLGDETLAPHVIVDAVGLAPEQLARLADLPTVAAMGRFSYTPVAPAPLVPGVDGGAFVGIDDAFLDALYRPLVIAGRLPAAGATDEILANEAMADAGHLRPGDRVELLAGFDEPSSIGGATVVGIVRGIFDVGVNAGTSGSLLLPASFLAARSDDVPLSPEPALLVRLRDGAGGLGAFEADMARITEQEAFVVSRAGDEVTDEALSIQRFGLLLLALTATAATAVAAVQALARLAGEALADVPILVALGLPPQARVGLAVGLALPIGVTAAAVGASVAVLASPLIPTGTARRIDPVTGIHPDLAVILAGAGAFIVLVIVAGAVLGSRRRTSSLPSHGAAAERRVRAARLLGAAPPAVRLGASNALGATPAPDRPAARSALVAAAVAVAGVVGVAIFGSSLQRMLDDPRLYGWSFDAAVVNTFEEPHDQFTAAVEKAGADGGIEDISAGRIVHVNVGDRSVEAYAFDEPVPVVHPTIAAGRAPADNEIVLGQGTARSLGVGVGDSVWVSGVDRSMVVPVVGTAAYPELGNNGDMAEAASLTAALVDELGTDARGSFAMVELSSGADAADLGPLALAGEVVPPFRGARVRQLETVGELPLVLSLFLVLTGIASVGHSLIRSVRGRTLEFAVLRALGFRPGDVRSTIRWQAMVTAVVGGIPGIVAGVIAGSWAWDAVVTRTGAVEHTVVPPLVVGLALPVSLVAVWAIAALPARRATRVSASHRIHPE